MPSPLTTGSTWSPFARHWIPALFARNLYNFLSAFWDKDAGKPVLDEEIGDAIRLTQGGKMFEAVRVTDRLN